MIIVGNGPSLNKTPLHEFSQVPSIGLNKIDLLYPRTAWRPTFVLCVNDIVVQQHWANWFTHGIPVFLSWKNRWYIPRSKRRNFRYFLSAKEPTFSFEPSSGMGNLGTVTYTAMQFAYYCGANPVILFGVDHSFAQPEHKGVAYKKRQGPDVNHFDPNYFPEGKVWGLANMECIEHAYRLARAAFEADGRQIYDATIEGKLDVFPKISLARAKELVESAAPTIVA